MPRIKPPEGAGATRDQLLRIAQTFAYNKTRFSEATGLSYWKSRQLVDKLRERKSIAVVLGERFPERKLAELKKAVAYSGFEFQQQRLIEKGIDRIVAIPPEPAKGKTYAKKLSRRKYQEGTITRYKYAAGKRIKLSPTDTIQIRAKGKGKSAGKSIKQLNGTLGDWSTAWSSWMLLAKETNFTARSFEIIVIR